MKRVTGIGGIFFKARDPQALGVWYKAHLGIDVQAWGGASFAWAGPDNPAGAGSTAWNLVPADADSFGPSAAPFMINYRVADLRGLLAALRAEGVAVEDRVEDSEYGVFAWLLDPEGNRIELWQPPDGQ
ncbi:VOC family protein [Chloroflexia bacterium SDU3-3]|nr:VOC family protein [Chloroflexia bacterium SDU3-3]